MKELDLKEIEKVLDEKVRPDMALHGGNIRVKKMEGSIRYKMLAKQWRLFYTVIKSRMSYKTAAI